MTLNSIVLNASHQPTLQFGLVNDVLLNKAQPSPTTLDQNNNPDDAPSELNKVPAPNTQQGLADDRNPPSPSDLTPDVGKDQLASNSDEHAPHVTKGVDPVIADKVAPKGSENMGNNNFITTVSTKAMAVLAI
ncbi:hypothetical protein DFH09DRAFT_1069680 [Mycena vulgaris]|nr:hypothetical protein DFH09DRAFT_1069680 [Mycena vulgaris]